MWQREREVSEQPLGLAELGKIEKDFCNIRKVWFNEIEEELKKR